MADVKWAMWNCSGILGSSAQEKIDYLRTTGLCDILILVETHHKDISNVQSILNTFTNKYHILHTEAQAGDPYAGIIVLVDKRFSVSNENVLLAGRLFNFKLKTYKTTYNISVLYGYTGSMATQSKMNDISQKLLTHHQQSDQSLILGDFNFVDNDLDRVNASKLGQNRLDKTLSTPWTQLVTDLDLTDPFRNKNPKRRMFSYIHTMHNAKSRIDRIYVSDTFANNIITYKHTQTPFTMAHKVVSFTLKEGVERGRGFWKMNTSILTDRAYQLIIEKTIQDVLNLRIQDPIERWLVFIETVRIETQAYCKRKRHYERSIKDICEKKLEILEDNPLLANSPTLNRKYEFYKSKLNAWTKNQISGYQTRIKTFPKFEAGEPNIAFFADLEKKTSDKKNICELKSKDGTMKYKTEEIKEVATDFYTELFSPKPVDSKATEKLLRNIKNKISPVQRASLDEVITLEELEKAVFKLQKGKSPGPDGLPAEFYQVFWDKIKHIYLAFINAVKIACFPASKNVSITTLIYKEKGEKCSLTYYRPIALMNVDVKILTKLLSMRLNFVLPSIIHKSQTAVYRRYIGDNVNLIRDLIDFANEMDEEAAMIFLDQEKAFDRVNHTVLLKTLQRFGFGPDFISWIKILYSNASTRLNINGFLTNRIQLMSGVRQGCPLSPLLYVIVIELLGLQLRSNPNIVGFNIEGENIISSHYSDDAVIKITQNRCFKEVYKDLKTYESGTGARVNYDKTKGLWLGKWKYRSDDPFEGLYAEQSTKINWTSENVKYLGIYVGNDSPDLYTFQHIIPKVKKRLNFWKPLALPILSKSRVIEIFHTSKLWYAASFYPIPAHLDKELNDVFMDYILFPKKKQEVNRMEMEKERLFGGIKLINTQLKSVTPKVQWLMRLITDDNLSIQFKVYSLLIGKQKGGLEGSNLIFAEHSYMQRHLKCCSNFYIEALHGISKLDTWKHFPNINNEHLYYNRIFSTTQDEDDDLEEKTVTPFQGNKYLCNIVTYGDLIAAENSLTQPKLKAVIRKKIESIAYIRPNISDHSVNGISSITVTFKHITQKFIYSQLIQQKSRDHNYQLKWIERSDVAINWDKVWESCHQQFFTEEVKSTIWEQTHLNFYTTYNYNKWHNTLHPCPLCRKIPDEVFHILFDCEVTRYMWGKLQGTLLKINPIPISTLEMALGIQPTCKREINSTILRNWVTFSLRHYIMKEERRAFYLSKYALKDMRSFVNKFNDRMRQEMMIKCRQYTFRGLGQKFEAIATINDTMLTKNGDLYTWKDIM